PPNRSAILRRGSAGQSRARPTTSRLRRQTGSRPPGRRSPREPPQLGQWASVLIPKFVGSLVLPTLYRRRPASTADVGPGLPHGTCPRAEGPRDDDEPSDWCNELLDQDRRKLPGPGNRASEFLISGGPPE